MKPLSAIKVNLVDRKMLDNLQKDLVRETRPDYRAALKRLIAKYERSIAG